MTLARLRWIILIVLSLSTVINYVDRQALSVLLPTLRVDLRLTSETYGAITTYFLIAYTIANVLMGLVIDKIGTRRGFSLSVGTWSIAGVAHAAVQGFAGLAFVRIMLGLGEAGNWPAGGKAVSQWFPPERRAFAMGFFDGGSALGAVVAPPLVAFLTIRWGWRSAFVVTGVLGFLWLALWLWVYDRPDRHRWLSIEDRTRVMGETQQTSAKALGYGAAFFGIIKKRQLWGLMATRMAATPVWWFYIFWLPDYLSKDRHFSLHDIGLFGWIPYVTVDLGKILGGTLSDRILRRGRSLSLARKSVMVLGALAMAGGLEVADAKTSFEAIFWVSLATFGFGMWSANILALHADIFPSSRMGSALGLTGMAASLGGALATYEIGLVVDKWGYHPVFVVAGSAALVACLALFFALGKVRPLKEAEL